jgi:two-component system phosphate regulon sensor histidine kinase PhoR
MKKKSIWFVFFLAITSLLVFQAFGLYYTYSLKKDDIEKNTNALLRSSVEKEVMSRYEKGRLSKGDIFTAHLTVEEKAKFMHGVKVYKFDEQELLEAGFYQQPAHISGFPFEIQTLDSIFRRELQKEDISDIMSLFYRDSTGLLIEQAGNLPESKIKKAFKTDPLLIINGNRVQAFVVISPPAIFKQMLLLLVSSFIALIILFFCIIYQTRTIYTQNELDKLKDDFFNAFTHNIKTPLGTIKSVLSNFKSGKIINRPEMIEKFGKIAIAQVEHLQLLIEKILTIAKLEDKLLTLNLSETDIPVMINELKDKYAIFENKQIIINTTFNIDNKKIILLDSELIKEAVSNLLDNAVKYSGKVVEINIACYSTTDTLQIQVKDNGYGISPKDQHNIFKKFERGAAVDRKEAKGFGIGLNFVKNVTELHGGTVSLSSQLGEGSEFTLSLPLPESLTINVTEIHDTNLIINNSR